MRTIIISITGHLEIWVAFLFWINLCFSPPVWAHGSILRCGFLGYYFSCLLSSSILCFSFTICFLLKETLQFPGNCVTNVLYGLRCFKMTKMDKLYARGGSQWMPMKISNSRSDDENDVAFINQIMKPIIFFRLINIMMQLGWWDWECIWTVWKWQLWRSTLMTPILFW